MLGVGTDGLGTSSFYILYVFIELLKKIIKKLKSVIRNSFINLALVQPANQPPLPAAIAVRLSCILLNRCKALHGSFYSSWGNIVGFVRLWC